MYQKTVIEFSQFKKAESRRNRCAKLEDMDWDIQFKVEKPRENLRKTKSVLRLRKEIGRDENHQRCTFRSKIHEFEILKCISNNSSKK